MLRSFFPELVMSTDLLSFEHPSVLLFCFSKAFTFLMDNNICAIWWQGIPTNSGDSYGHKLSSTYSRLISILLLDGYDVKPPEVQTVWHHRQVQRYLSISLRYIHHWWPCICWAHSLYIYPREQQLNKANTSDKETSFWDLNIKFIGSNIHTSIYDKR